MSYRSGSLWDPSGGWLGEARGATFLASMALAICWGLAFATRLTLVVIPSVCTISQDIRRVLSRKGDRSP